MNQDYIPERGLEGMKDRNGNSILSTKQVIDSIVSGNASFEELFLKFYGIHPVGESNSRLINHFTGKLAWTGMDDPNKPDDLHPERILSALGRFQGHLFGKEEKEHLKYGPVRESYSRALGPQRATRRKLGVTVKGMGLAGLVVGSMATGVVFKDIPPAISVSLNLAVGAWVTAVGALAIYSPRPPIGLEVFRKAYDMARKTDEVLRGLPDSCINQDILREDYLDRK